MSKVTGPTHWKCDDCGADGSAVDEQETLPYQWLSIGIICGTPQLQSEARDRHVHFCPKCGEMFLFTQLTGDSDDIARLRHIFRRLAMPPPSHSAETSPRS